MNKKRIYIILTILLMGIIFYMSNQPASISLSLSKDIEEILKNIPIVGNVLSDILNSPRSQFIIRKSAHLLLYCFLSIISFVAIYEIKRDKQMAILLSFLGTFIYACSDEIHQLFIPGRGSQIMDVGIDSIGAIIGLALVNIILILKDNMKKSSLYKN